MAQKFSFIYVTCPNKLTAVKIGEHLLQLKLIACANVVPGMESIYRWKGRLQRAKEVVLLLKTRSLLFKKVEKEILSLHPYSCPCIVEIPLGRGNKKYLKWVSDETV